MRAPPSRATAAALLPPCPSLSKAHSRRGVPQEPVRKCGPLPTQPQVAHSQQPLQHTGRQSTSPAIPSTERRVPWPLGWNSIKDAPTPEACASSPRTSQAHSAPRYRRTRSRCRACSGGCSGRGGGRELHGQNDGTTILQTPHTQKRYPIASTGGAALPAGTGHPQKTKIEHMREVSRSRQDSGERLRQPPVGLADSAGGGQKSP